MANSSWKKKPLSNDYNNAANWSNGAPTTDGYIAQFGASQKTAIAVTSGIQVGAWVFAKQAPHYVFTAGAGNYIEFFATGIVNGGGVRIISHYDLEFLNSSSAGAVKITNFGAVLFTNSAKAGHAIIDNRADLNFFGVSSADHARIENKETVSFHADSTAGNAVITNRGDINLFDHSTAGHAHIDNKPSSTMDFFANSTAGSAAITTRSGAMLSFMDLADGGNARLITKAGGTVIFGLTAGANGDGFVSVGSIEGAGDYYLGGNFLDVGFNNRSMTVTGTINDGGRGGGSGAGLTKIGSGTLTLANAHNTYSGGTALGQGTLYLKVAGAAGTGNIYFTEFSTTHETHQTLKLANKALPAHQFTTLIDGFGRGDTLDLTGLKFAPGAKAVYDSDNGILKVKSGHVTDTFTLFGVNLPFGFTPHFKVMNDGHGGTKVVYAPKPAHAKSADHDSFKFNADVSHARHTPIGPDPVEHTPATLAHQHDDAPTSVIAEIFSHHDTGFAHHGDLFV